MAWEKVWLAEQKEPVRRRVALKLVKAGMNTREVVARFESERQALAMMDHPAIARVFDAGSTLQGAPYFVMEYVAGIPITAYCDNHRLNTQERLELFIHVCEGVQHAHQKAIIHRDLKPSNILVTELDGRATPKIIDFGIAKALTARLSSDTMFTRVGVLIGTPAYMSPEQANSSGEDIDTRTDVYSLGIVFYELLAGVPPIDLTKLVFDEFLRRLRDDDPPKPSTRIRTQDSAASADVAHKRRTERMALARLLRGDLDSIALKALEKDRSRRYGSPSDFVADIRRYLKNEPVVAVPPSAAYRIRKFGHRYRGALATICAFALVLILAAGVSIWQGIRATRQRDRADAAAAVAQAVNDFLQKDLLAQASANNQSGAGVKADPDLKVRTALDRAAAGIAGKFDRHPDVEAAIRDTMGETYLDLGVYPEARKQLQRALELQRQVLGPENSKTLKTAKALGITALRQGKYIEAEGLLSQLLPVSRRVLGPEHRDTLACMYNLAVVYYFQSKYSQAEALASQTLEIQRRVLGPEDPDTLLSMMYLANFYDDQGKYPQAEALHNENLEVQRRVLGPEHPNTLRTMSNLANAYDHQGKYALAEALHRETLEIKRHVLGHEHSSTLISQSNLALVYNHEGEYAQAEALYRETLEVQRHTLGSEHPDTLGTLSAIAASYQRQGKYNLAETYAAAALALRRRALGSISQDIIASSAADLALAYQSQGKYAQSEPLAREAMEKGRQKNRPDDWQLFRAESLLGASLAGQKKYAEAEPLLIEGYQGMANRKSRISVPDSYHLDRARDWIVQLYQAWGKSEKAAEWKEARVSNP